MTFDISTTVTETNTGVTLPVTSGYVEIQPNYCYPYPQPWGGWGPSPYYQPWINPWPYIPPQVVTQQIVIPRGLTDEEIDRIADKVAEKLRAKPKR